MKNVIIKTDKIVIRQCTICGAFSVVRKGKWKCQNSICAKNI